LAASAKKADGIMLFCAAAGRQQDDGRWEADAILSSCSPYTSSEEREAIAAKCPGLSTAMMLQVGRIFAAEILGHSTKQVVEVRLGDGRGRADQVETATVELSAEEKSQREVTFRAIFESTGLRPDGLQRAEAWLDRLPVGSRPALEESARAELDKRFAPLTASARSREREVARLRVSSEERRRRDEARRTKAAELREKERRAAEELKRRLDHFKTLAPADIRAVPWSQAKSLHFVGGGSGGVTLVDLEDSCVVLKVQGRTAASELFAERVADVLQVPVAHVRIVRRGDAEFGEIRQTASQCTVFGVDELHCYRTFFGVTRSRDDSGVLYEFGGGVGLFGVLEYVGGHALMGLDGNAAMRSPARELLRGLGRLCALDVIINNMDRMPLPVWQNEGNLGNVMVVEGSSPVLGIDQQVNPVLKGPGLDSYVQKVARLVADSAPGGDPRAIVARLRTALLENCGAELADADAQQIVEGLFEGLGDAAASWRSGELERHLEEAEAQCLERMTLDGPMLGKRPELHALGDMRRFVCEMASHVDGALGGLGGRA